MIIQSNVCLVLLLFAGICIANEQKDNSLKLEGIVISEQSFNSEDEYEAIQSNIDYVNSLRKQYINSDEISDEAYKSYYVDYYLAQIRNGGFSQFVYNTGWDITKVNFVRAGLADMKATRNLELFNNSAKILDELGADRIDEYLDSEYFGTNEERDILNAFNDQFYDLQKSEDLIRLNSKWLKQHAELVVLNEKSLSEQLESIANSIPDRDFREQQALEAEPRFKKLIRALCKASGQELKFVTAGGQIDYKESKVLAWHFITNDGHHYMVEFDQQAIMFVGDSKQVVVTIPAGSEYGGEVKQ